MANIKNTGIAEKLILTIALCVFLAVFALPQESRVIHEIQSKYQHITVQDTANGYRQLIFDGNLGWTGAIQSEMSLSDHYMLTLAYARYIMAALPLVEKSGRILILGLGGASMQRYLHRLLPDAQIETAELDPDILKIAASHFFFIEDKRQMVHLGDGRAFIENSKEKYDIIFLDAYSATSIPYALSTREFIMAAKEHLSPGGIVCANLWYTAPEYLDMLKTYSDVFPEIHLLDCIGSGNAILMAYPQKTGLTTRSWVNKAREFEKNHPTGLNLPQLIERGVVSVLPDFSNAGVIRDRK